MRTRQAKFAQLIQAMNDANHFVNGENSAEDYEIAARELAEFVLRSYRYIEFLEKPKNSASMESDNANGVPFRRPVLTREERLKLSKLENRSARLWGYEINKFMLRLVRRAYAPDTSGDGETGGEA